MIRYLFDTDIASYLMKSRFPQLQVRVSSTPQTDFAISAVTAAEILFGLQPFGQHHPIHIKATRFLEAMQILDWPAAAASIYADIRYRTRQQPLGERDMMIAAHAMALDATLVTNNTRHFGRIGDPLRIDNWLW